MYNINYSYWKSLNKNEYSCLSASKMRLEEVEHEICFHIEVLTVTS